MRLNKRNCIPKRKVSEREFHTNLIVGLRRAVRAGVLPSTTVIDGRSEGNIPMRMLIKNKMLGYVVGTPDVSILNTSSDKTYNQLNIELKIGSEGTRQSQDKRLMLLERYRHCAVVLKSGTSPKRAIKRAVRIVKAYLSGPPDKLEKYRYKPPAKQATLDSYIKPN